MSRRSQKIRRRTLSPDPIYGNLMVTKIVNRAMIDGKKSVSEKEVYGALKSFGEEATAILEKAFNNIRPEMEVRPRRIGGAAYQVPMPVHGVRKDSLAVRWLVNAARARSNKEFHTFAEKLAAELKDASNGEGAAVKKRQDMEHTAEANRAFAHFKW